MNKRFPRILVLILASTLVAIPVSSQANAQTKISPGFNLFSPQQDVEIGRQSAAQVDQQLPILHDSRLQQYVSEVGKRLAAQAPGPEFPYQFKVVDVSDINAFALPGGFMYVNRGLIATAHDEAELAGVMGHEMAHVALRHGTNQASKAYLAQAGLGVLGGLLGNSGTSQIIGAIGGFGLNSLFLKFSRTDEEQADIVGAQIMARAGYDPMAMARMFETLRQEAGHDPSKLEEFFSDHPAPKDREARIEKEARLIGNFHERPPVGNFAQIQAELDRLPPARSMKQLAQMAPSQGGKRTGGNGQPVDVNIERPSGRLRTYVQNGGLFEVRYPENWKVYPGRNSLDVTFAPEGGIVDAGNGQPDIVCGVVINHYAPFESRTAGEHVSLQDATDDLLQQIMRSNPDLKVIKGSKHRGTVHRQPTLSAALSGQSPVTGQEERVTLRSQELPDGHIIYALFIAPGRYYGDMSQVMNEMMASLQVNEQAEHERAE
jgi:Zn-dependent protease with chaperone function